MSKKQGIITASNSFQEFVEHACSVVRTSKKKSAITTAFNQAFSQVETVLASIPPKDKGFSATKKSLKVVNNLLGGVLDGLESDDLTLRELKALSRTIKNEKLPAFMEAVAADTSRTKDEKPTEQDGILQKLVIALDDASKDVKRSLSNSTGFQKAVEDVIQNMTKGQAPKSEDEPEATDDETTPDKTRAYLKGLSGLRTKLPPTAGKGGFTIFRMPVVPVFEPIDRKLGLGGRPTTIVGQPNPTNILKQAGIRSIAVEEYVIIDNQLLLAISKSHLPEKDVPIKSKRQKPVHLTPLEYAKLVLSVIDDNTGKGYTLVDDTPVGNPKSKDVVFFWIMPSTTLSFLLKKRFPKLKQWGLPF